MTRKLLPLRRVEGQAAELSDEALLAACALGEAAALGALYDCHHAGVRRFLGRLSGTDERDLDDLVQTTFEAVPRAAASFDGRAQVRTWLFGVAGNVVRHHVRVEVRRRRLADAAAQVVVASDDTTARLEERERTARLGEAILALSPALREAFVLVYLEGVPGPEAARVLGVREGALWKRLHEARTRLRDALREVLP